MKIGTFLTGLLVVLLVLTMLRDCGREAQTSRTREALSKLTHEKLVDVGASGTEAEQIDASLLLEPRFEAAFHSIKRALLDPATPPHAQVHLLRLVLRGRNRRSVTSVLGRILELTRSPVAKVRIQAVETSCWIARSDPSVALRAVQALGDSNPEVGVAASVSLTRLHPTPLDLLRATLLEGVRTAAKEHAVRALALVVSDNDLDDARRSGALRLLRDFVEHAEARDSDAVDTARRTLNRYGLLSDEE